MCLWQIPTPDNIGCFFPERFGPLVFSPLLQCSVTLPVHACTSGRLVFAPPAVCVLVGALSLQASGGDWNVESHMSDEQNKVRWLRFLCATAGLCITHLNGLFTQPH